MQEMKPVKEGKVREIYDNGDSLIIAFDTVLQNAREAEAAGTPLE